MTLRDYFAAKAMQAFIARQGYAMDGETFDERVSRWSYETAGAMLCARDESPAPTVNSDMLTALETVLAGGHLTTGEQAIVANAIAKATGRDVADVVKGE